MRSGVLIAELIKIGVFLDMTENLERLRSFVSECVQV
jgi:hypothetical protein